MKLPWLRNRRRDEELEAEIRSHLEMAKSDRIERGESPDEARVNARREFGNVGLVKEVTREMWGWTAIERLRQDLRFGLRMLRKNPGYSLIAIVTLALGIGANTTIFSVLDSLLLKPLPGIAEPDRLVQIGRTNKGQGFNSSAYADYRDYRDQTTTFAGVAAESEQQFHLGTDKAAARVKGALVTGNYFDVLGVRAALGRLLQPAEAEIEGANPVAVISERLWRNQLSAAPDVVGQTISLNSHIYTIIGVASEFNGTNPLDEKTDVWIPVTMWRHGNPWMVKIGVDWLNKRDSDFVELVGRLKPGVTVEQAQADLTVIAERLAKSYPDTNSKRGARVIAGLGLSPADQKELRQFFAIQFGIVIIVLLIACANVAGLQLASTAARQKEIGVRLALGAGRWRIVRQLLTESTLLALFGGVCALLVANWLTDWIRTALSDEQREKQAQIAFTLDWRILGFTLGLSIFTGLLFGLAPAVQSTRLNLIPLLKDSGASVSRKSRSRLRNVLVIAQIALSMILLVSAGLCVRTLQNARAINLGFAMDNLLTAKLDLGRQNYSEKQGYVFYQQLLERMNSLPGVQAASLAINVPLQNSSYGNNVGVEGQGDFNLRYNIVTPGYLDTLGIPLLFGRDFNEKDHAASPRVAIINESFARYAWPNENPVGKFFNWRERAGGYPVEVIGVMRDIKVTDLFDDPPRFAYFPLAQRYDGGMTLQMRTSIQPEQLLAAVQQEIRAIDPKLPVYNVKTVDQYRRDALSEKRIQAGLIGGFGLLALVLASLGLYGVLSYGVAQRTSEIGIRMALGAQSREVLRLIVGQGIKLIAIGLAIGLAGALAVTRVLKSVLYGVSTTDPLTFAVIALLLTSVALLACWIPARRATRVDPLIAFRQE
jgi:predicted permease